MSKRRTGSNVRQTGFELVVPAHRPDLDAVARRGRTERRAGPPRMRMNKTRARKKGSAMAHFRHCPLLDLLVDAAHFHLQAKHRPPGYETSRAARASVVASFLSIECFANCLVSSLDVAKPLASELDKLPALAKIDLYFKLKDCEALDRGARVVQRVTELIRARNDYVHPKVSESPAEPQSPEESEEVFILPFAVNAEFWPALQIPRQPFLWDAVASHRALDVVAGFLRFVLIDRLQASVSDLVKIVFSRFEFDRFVMPGVYEEYIVEMEALAHEGIDFGFLDLRGSAAGGAPTPTPR